MRDNCRKDGPGHDKVLVAESDAGLRSLIAFMLRTAGYTVLTAADGESTLRALIESRPDLAVVDRTLDRLSGMHVCSRILDALAGSAPPVIMISDRTNQADVSQALAMGVLDFISMPSQLCDLVASVREALPRAP
ncbi:response regulator transcription factor [Actinoplanes sp. HUAS TT8]|uniref:response regulator transcription factor n=1 Tax=Actinoplanes sp. HUAS TT8 TaxID=3447453 RepID=UPI003F520D49